MPKALAENTKKRTTVLYQVEIIALFSLCLMILLYFWTNLETRLLHPERHFGMYYIELWRSIVFLYPLTLLLTFIAIIISTGRDKTQDVLAIFLKRYLNLKMVVEHIRLLHSTALCLLIFAHLKHLIPYINNSLHDPLLLKIDQTILGPKLISSLLSQDAIEKLLPMMEMAYQAFYPYLSMILCVFVVIPNRPLSHKFCAFYGYLWIVGVLSVYAFPTWGPCFYLPDAYSTFPESSMSILQQTLWTAHQVLLKEPLNPHLVFAISGLPSLHFALTLGGSIFLWKLHWLPGVISSFFALLTFLSTIFFGWHYLLDDLASFILVGFCYLLASRAHIRSNPE